MSRLNWLQESREGLLDIARKYQQKLLAYIEQEYLNDLDTDGNTIKFNGKNLSSVAGFEKEIIKIAELEGDKLLEWYLDRVDQNSKLNYEYFAKMTSVKSSKSALNSALSTISQFIGYDGQKFKKNSIIYDISRVQEPIRFIKAQVVQAITRKQDWDIFKKSISNYINPKKKGAGIIENYLRTNAYDTFMQVDRTIHNYMGENLGLDHFLYSEGLMDTSRPFCREKVGKVFTMQEVIKWKDQEWRGKNEDYDPFRDVGGYNCTHSLNRISKTLYDDLVKEQKEEDAKNSIEKSPDFKEYIKDLKVNVSKNFLPLIPDDVSFSSKDKRGAYYDPKSKTVNINNNLRRQNSKWYAEAVIYHEFGHSIDYQKGYYKSKEFSTIIKKYRKNIDFKSLDKKINSFNVESDDQKEQLAALADTLMALNINYGYGHSHSYFKQKYSPEKEIIAHMFEIKFKGNDIFKNLAPDLYDDLLNFELK